MDLLMKLKKVIPSIGINDWWNSDISLSKIEILNGISMT
jgi:hypothetical protein